MTYAPAMKFHSYYFNSYLKLISLILILTSCASLNTSNKSYNLEGKLSYISKAQSSIFKVKISTNIKKSSIEVYDTLGINLLYRVSNENNLWISSNERHALFHNELPSPSEFYFLLANQCRASQECNIKIAGKTNDSRINLILNEV
tara:strand:+ start:36 stop:473 length:438 start_codon:yes stop_codon:yes gene_type:complete